MTENMLETKAGCRTAAQRQRDKRHQWSPGVSRTSQLAADVSPAPPRTIARSMRQPAQHRNGFELPDSTCCRVTTGIGERQTAESAGVGPDHDGHYPKSLTPVHGHRFLIYPALLIGKHYHISLSVRGLQ